ncbi:hypothetical protein [Saccharopolyspora griseoalba]|uniref:Uncharacterized protein n=1 Tax=Saccharopolyspora griseoalba TaxID=1431848 RepID=A0ABW2LMQ2_9PSEU
MTFQEPMPVVVRNGMGISALVLGIVGLLFAWIPFVGSLGFVLGILTVVLGGAGIYGSQHGDDDLQINSITLTAQHDGRVAQQDYLSGDLLPNAQLRPGGETAFTTVYEVGAGPGELQISVQPNYFAEDTVCFTGQFQP